MQALGVWDDVQLHLVFGGDVAGVLALAKQGRARVAVVYRTDARQAAPLVVLDLPEDAPTATIVAGIATRSGRADAARAFLTFLGSRRGQAILARHGSGSSR